MGKFATK